MMIAYRSVGGGLVTSASVWLHLHRLDNVISDSSHSIPVDTCTVPESTVEYRITDDARYSSRLAITFTIKYLRNSPFEK